MCTNSGTVQIPVALFVFLQNPNVLIALLAPAFNWACEYADGPQEKAVGILPFSG